MKESPSGHAALLHAEGVATAAQFKVFFGDDEAIILISQDGKALFADE